MGFWKRQQSGRSARHSVPSLNLKVLGLKESCSENSVRPLPQREKLASSVGLIDIPVFESDGSIEDFSDEPLDYSRLERNASSTDEDDADLSTKQRSGLTRAHTTVSENKKQLKSLVSSPTFQSQVSDNDSSDELTTTRNSQANDLTTADFNSTQSNEFSGIVRNAPSSSAGASSRKASQPAPNNLKLNLRPSIPIEQQFPSHRRSVLTDRASSHTQRSDRDQYTSRIKQGTFQMSSNKIGMEEIQKLDWAIAMTENADAREALLHVKTVLTESLESINYLTRSVSRSENHIEHLESITMEVYKTSRATAAEKVRIEQELSDVKAESDRLKIRNCQLADQLESIGAKEGESAGQNLQALSTHLESLIADRNKTEQKCQATIQSLLEAEHMLVDAKTQLAQQCEQNALLSKLIKYYHLHLSKCNPSYIISPYDKERIEQLQIADYLDPFSDSDRSNVKRGKSKHKIGKFFNPKFKWKTFLPSPRKQDRASIVAPSTEGMPSGTGAVESYEEARAASEIERSVSDRSAVGNQSNIPR